MERRISILTILLLAVVLAQFGGPAFGEPPASAAAVQRVMPLGDSLTDGYVIPGGYRTRLWNRAAGGGFSIDLVGSLSNGPTELPDHDHEGHPGWRIDELAASVNGWVATYQPQHILLLIGTNDILQNYDLPNAPARLGLLIDQISANAPQANIVVGSIPTINMGPYNDWAQQYNLMIPGVVSQRANQGRHVSYVDIYSVISISDLYSDGIHLVDSGNTKLADVWYSRLSVLLSAGPNATLTPVPGTPTATFTPTRTPTPVSATPTSTPSSGGGTCNTFSKQDGGPYTLVGAGGSVEIWWKDNNRVYAANPEQKIAAGPFSSTRTDCHLGPQGPSSPNDSVVGTCETWIVAANGTEIGMWYGSTVSVWWTNSQGTEMSSPEQVVGSSPFASTQKQCRARY